MFMLLQAMIWANSCSANEITDENKSTLMSRLVKKVQSRSINDTESGRSLAVSQTSTASVTQVRPHCYFSSPLVCISKDVFVFRFLSFYTRTEKGDNAPSKVVCIGFRLRHVQPTGAFPKRFTARFVFKVFILKSETGSNSRFSFF